MQSPIFINAWVIDDALGKRIWLFIANIWREKQFYLVRGKKWLPWEGVNQSRAREGGIKENSLA